MNTCARECIILCGHALELGAGSWRAVLVKISRRTVGRGDHYQPRMEKQVEQTTHDERVGNVRDLREAQRPHIDPPPPPKSTPTQDARPLSAPQVHPYTIAACSRRVQLHSLCSTNPIASHPSDTCLPLLLKLVEAEQVSRVANVKCNLRKERVIAVSREARQTQAQTMI